MNCKPGDLAVIVSSDTGVNVGKVLAVVSLATFVEIESEVPGAWLHGPIWRTDTPAAWVDRNGVRKQACLVPDRRLRPLRDSDGEDQILTRAGKPSDIKSPAAA